ncbi:MAG TPA: Uma2 family endonuclease [Saprospiraceae bacterium]|nr:Uma2 family endonuclease [Saprospiraceae bacterium]HMQ83275.1 Uma2 family endonuclease [Saprospiraceae bacterium]
MPNRIHGYIQSDLIFILRTKYNEQFDFPSEVTLDTDPASTPDILIYPRTQKLDRKETQAKEKVMPLTTIEILSPSQSLEYLADKVWEVYFPAGVKSAWIVVPAFKAIYVLLPDGQNLYFSEGLLEDPAIGISLEVKPVFERLV